MYLPYWGMQMRPFDNSHETRFFVPLESSALARMKLHYALSQELGVATVTGVAGVGKTELARMVMNDLAEEGWAVAYVGTLPQRVETLLGVLARFWGASAPAAPPLEALLDQLTTLHEADTRVLAVIDEMHTIEDVGILEGLRALLNLEAGGRRLVNLVLVGQDGMDRLLARASAFASHVALQVRLQPMSAEETKKYILYRLKVAGCSRGIFTRRAAELVYEFSLGLPRNVNRLCELALMTGFGLQAKKIGPEFVRMAAQELGLAPRPDESSPPPGGRVDILAELASPQD